jgi:hypothetical protein
MSPLLRSYQNPSKVKSAMTWDAPEFRVAFGKSQRN